ncbi:hypothetical protein K439DRAFT_1621229 [Ramaria rubella]|nr:hypothetical protein K439DRAFT_1621229 [Ramaria rubella]
MTMSFLLPLSDLYCTTVDFRILTGRETFDSGLSYYTSKGVEVRRFTCRKVIGRSRFLLVTREILRTYEISLEEFDYELVRETYLPVSRFWVLVIILVIPKDDTFLRVEKRRFHVVGRPVRKWKVVKTCDNLSTTVFNIVTRFLVTRSLVTLGTKVIRLNSVQDLKEIFF